MKNYVAENGIDGSKAKILQCFDYLTKDEIREEYAQIIRNPEKEAEPVRNGEQLRKCLMQE